MDSLFENSLVRIEAEPSEIPWLKIFTQCGSREFSDCDESTRQEIWRMLFVLEKEMLAFYKPEKINIASFANYLPRVHWHIMARFREDSYFPEPMWGKKQRDGQLNLVPVETFVETILKKLEG